MFDMDEYEAQLRKDPRAGKIIEQAASSEEGRRIVRSIDAAAAEKAAREGDTRTLKNILSQVLSSPDGKALVQKLQQAAKEK